jgi:hypothetical protein
MNDSGQLGSAVPELRSTWRTHSSCSTGLMLADDNDIQHGDERDHVREHATAGFLD